MVVGTSITRIAKMVWRWICLDQDLMRYKRGVRRRLPLGKSIPVRFVVLLELPIAWMYNFKACERDSEEEENLPVSTKKVSRRKRRVVSSWICISGIFQLLKK